MCMLARHTAPDFASYGAEYSDIVLTLLLCALQNEGQASASITLARYITRRPRSTSYSQQPSLDNHLSFNERLVCESRLDDWKCDDQTLPLLPKIFVNIAVMLA